MQVNLPVGIIWYTAGPQVNTPPTALYSQPGLIPIYEKTFMIADTQYFIH